MFPLHNHGCPFLWGFPEDTVVKNLPANRCRRCRRHKRHGFDPWVGKIPLEEEMATHCSILAWRIPWGKEPGGLWCMGSQRVGHDWAQLSATPLTYWSGSSPLASSILNTTTSFPTFPRYPTQISDLKANISPPGKASLTPRGRVDKSFLSMSQMQSTAYFVQPTS